jgi:transcriptional regulator GlxA family with amidase domain
MHHYLLMRLNKARQLILLSQISIRSTALACGFASLPVFSRSYRTQFGNSPSEHRRLFRAQGLGGNLSQQIQPLIIDAGQSNPGQLLN